MKTIALAGTLDTKGVEFSYVKNLIEELGCRTFTIHTGTFEPTFSPDVGNEEVVRAAGYDIKEVVAKNDRALATEVLANGMKTIVPRLYEEGKFDGIISFGGSGGTAIATAAMRMLPIGVPKVMVSTMASGNVTQYVGTSDIVMIPSIVDVAGLNKISKTIFRNAVAAIVGMVKAQEEYAPEVEEQKPLVATTMFGVTTPCIKVAENYLEEQGYEVLVFHATGTGGKTMEALIDAGFFKGVLDLTTTEWCDQIVGGVLAAGTDRCSAAIRKKVPQVVSVGACDMVNFGPIETVPTQFSERKFYKHNPSVTLMRTTQLENSKVGEALSEKWNKAETEMLILLPEKGVSMIDAEGQPFEGEIERKTLFESIQNGIDNPKVEIRTLEYNINDPEFAITAAKELIRLMEKES